MEKWLMPGHTAREGWSWDSNLRALNMVAGYFLSRSFSFEELQRKGWRCVSKQAKGVSTYHFNH